MLDQAALGAPDGAPTPATCCSRWRCGRRSPTGTTSSRRPGTPAGSARPSWSGSPPWSGAARRTSPKAAGAARAASEQRRTCRRGPGRLAARGLPAVRRPDRPAPRPAVARPVRGRPAGAAASACAPPSSGSATWSTASPAQRHAAAAERARELDTRTADVAARAKRGADVGGLLGPLEHDAARAERDLIVGASTPPGERARRGPGQRRCAPSWRPAAPRCATWPRGASPRSSRPRAWRSPTSRRSARSPPTPPPSTPTWCASTPSPGR